MNVSPLPAAQAADTMDDRVVEDIVAYLTDPAPRSFFLFAGAGSGKTHTLKEVLARLTGQQRPHAVGMAFADRLRRKGQQLAVITYTRAAAGEIERRVDSNPLVAVSTIHSFCWRLIEGFDEDIRAWIREALSKKLAELEADEPKPSNRAKRSLDERQAAWHEDVEKKRKELVELDDVSRFTYSPDNERFGQGALNHSQVLDVTARLLERPTMQRLVADRFPIIFIDESQDTFKRMLGPLLDLERKTSVRLGLLGDHRQRIYLDGEPSLVAMIPADWARPALRLNRRCPKRVVELINRIWVDKIEGRTEVPHGGEQVPLSNAPTGHVRLYLGDHNHLDKPGAEEACARDMAKQADDPGWSEPGHCERLVLEHQLAANRGGFGALYGALNAYDPNGARSGAISVLSVLENVLLPLYRAVGSDGRLDARQELDALRPHSPLLARDRMAQRTAQEQRTDFTQARHAARALRALWDAPSTTLADVLRCARDTGLLTLDDRLLDALAPPDDEGPGSERSRLLRAILCQPWAEYTAWRRYLAGEGAQQTHQGVKGLEYQRVLAVLDDTGASGTLFAYDRVFGASALSKSDNENLKNGRETSIDRTIRLLYVACSRAERSLALVLWTSSPNAVKETMLHRGWFNAAEIRFVADVLQVPGE